MNDRELARWVVAGLFGSFWLLFALGNGAILLGLPRKPPSPEPARGRSMVPMVGGLAGGVACLAAPGVGLKWAWVPLLLDAGALPMLVLFGALTVKEALKKR